MRKTIFWLVLLLLAVPGNSFAAENDRRQSVIPLRDISFRPFATVPPPAPEEIIPSFKEKRFPLAKASNFTAVEKLLGGLSEAQKKYLEQHRFLLLPKKEALYIFPDGEEQGLFDEMLHNFDAIGGPEAPVYRKSEHAVLLGPDVFLQALHTYFSQRLKGLEKNELRVALTTMLTHLYDNAKALSNASEKDAAAHWQRLRAQMVVPLVLLANCHKAAPEDIEGPDDVRPDDTDTLDKALELLAPYSKDFSPELLAGIRTELERVYAASEQGVSTLGLSPAYAPQGMIDYTQFKARGHYEAASTSRAYFRAMIWLGQLGWDLEKEQGLADGLNFALAMSHDPSGSAHRQAWQRIMELSSFFVGYPDAPAYPEWQRFLAGHSPAGLTAQSSADTALLRHLAANLENMPQPQGPFSSLRTKSETPVLTVFPQRFTVPWLIGDKLTYHDSLRRNLPAVFSALWVPALMGNSFAQSLLPEQVKLCLAARPNASSGGAPLAGGADGLTPLQEVQVENSASYVLSLQNHMAELASALKAEQPESWFSSIGAAWFHLMGALTADYGDGYPLYMRDPAFGAKQLESFLAAFTALKHDTILYEKPLYAELGSGDEERKVPPVPKGFVEPNLPFWRAMLHTVAHMEEGFKQYSLYPKDLEEFGALTRFRKSLKLCLELAEKELRGQPLSEAEYENIRTLRLQYMAEPLGYPHISTEEALSGLIVDVQTANLNDATGAGPVIVYEALAEPHIMLALVGNEKSPRVVVGMAYNHREFITPYGARLTDGVWKRRAYGPELDEGADNFSFKDALPLPAKNFWYDSLRP